MNTVSKQLVVLRSSARDNTNSGREITKTPGMQYFRGFLIPKRGDIVCPNESRFHPIFRCPQKLVLLRLPAVMIRKLEYLLYAGVDLKTVQYLAGHENSKTTMDIYARAKYNKLGELFDVVNRALAKNR